MNQFKRTVRAALIATLFATTASAQSSLNG